jgi:hypothetical protein
MKWIDINKELPTYYECVFVRLATGEEIEAWRANDGEDDIWTKFGTYEVISRREITRWKRHRTEDCCKTEGCLLPVKVKGWCKKHYDQEYTRSKKKPSKPFKRKEHTKTVTNRKGFIKKAQAIHGEDKYDYSKVVYVSTYTKVKIKCNVHNKVFEQSPSNHLRGYGCKECGNFKNK